MNFNLIRFSPLFLFLSLQLFSQQKIQGIIIDEVTQEPIKGVSIYNESTKNGTISNEDGEFELTNKNYPVKLVFSHVSYKKMAKEISSNSFQKIVLPLAIIELPEATTGNPAIAILNAVIRKAQKDSTKTFYKNAYYQKTSQNGNKYLSIHESLMNVAWNTKGVLEWSPINVRLAELEYQGLKHKNMLYSTLRHSSIFREFYAFPLNNNNISEKYNFKILNYSNSGTDEELVAISCIPKIRNRKEFQFEGVVYVFTKYDALKYLKGNYTYPKNSDKWQNKGDNVEVEYDLNIDNFMIPKSILLEKNYRNRFSRSKITMKSWVYFTQDLEDLGKGKVYSGKFLDDLKVFEEVPYNAEFWKNNVPIRHTKIQQEVIKDLESKGKFTTNIK